MREENTHSYNRETKEAVEEKREEEKREPVKPRFTGSIKNLLKS